MPVRLALRNAVASDWAASNPVLALGEEGLETDSRKFKIGDGSTPWTGLPYWDQAPAVGFPISAGTTGNTLSALSFDNNALVSFGLAGSTITASVFTNYQPAGPYLTTAALSQDSSRYAGTAGAIVGGSMLLNTSGLTISLPAYLTTAQPPGNYLTTAQPPGAYLTTAMASNAVTLSNIKVSGGNASSLVSALTFSNANGVSFGFDGSNVTATVATNYQSVGNYLTTAARSQDSSKYAGTSLGVTGASATLNSAGLALSVVAGGGGAGSLTISAGTLSAAVSAVTFSNANGVSFGFDGTNLTAIVATNYQSQGAYLTTAALSADSSKYAGTHSGATNCSVTVNTSGVSVSVGPYITTAMASNAATISNINVSAGATSANLSALTFSNSNGVSFGITNSIITATVATNYQSQGAYLTTAMQSNAATISNIDLSAGTVTTLGSAFTFSNSNGVSFGFGTGASAGVLTATVVTSYQPAGAYLTTAMQSNAATISNIKISAGASSSNVSAVTFSNAGGVSWGYDGTNVTATVATNYQSAGAYLTTAALSSQTLAISLSGNTATTNSSQILNGGYALAGGNNVTLQQSNNTISISVGNYITTADLSQNSSKYAGINSGATNCSVTVNTSGVSVSVGAYITTADLSQNSSKYAGIGFTSTTTGGTAIVGTNNTAGLSLGIPNFITTAMLSNAATISNINVSAGTTSGNVSALTFSNANGISFGYDGTNVTGSIATSLSVVNFSAGSASGNLGSVVLSNSNGISFGLNGSTVTAYLGMLSYYENIPYMDTKTVSLSASGSVIQVLPFILPMPLSAGFVRVPVSMSYDSTAVGGTTANSSFTQNMSFSDAVVIYSQNTGANSLSLASVTSSFGSWCFQTSVTMNANGSQYTVAFNVTYPTQGTTSNYTTSYAVTSGTLNISSQSMTLFTGPRWLDIPFGASLNAGNYWIAFGRSTNTASNAGPNLATASIGISYIGISQPTIVIGVPGLSVNAQSVQLQPGLGAFTTNSAISTRSAMALSQITLVGADAKMYFQMIRRA